MPQYSCGCGSKWGQDRAGPVSCRRCGRSVYPWSVFRSGDGRSLVEVVDSWVRDPRAAVESVLEFEEAVERCLRRGGEREAVRVRTVETGRPSRRELRSRMDEVRRELVVLDERFEGRRLPDGAER